MASYQNVDHKSNRNKTPTIKVMDDDQDEGQTPRPSVKVRQLFVL